MRHVSCQAGPKGPVDTKGQRSTSRGDLARDLIK